jgi:glycosyltransferase involved in cell wall biosynthesis
MRLPVVATNVGGIPDFLADGENARLVRAGDADGMVRAITRLPTEPDLAARLSVNGRRLAERSSLGTGSAAAGATAGGCHDHGPVTASTASMCTL